MMMMMGNSLGEVWHISLSVLLLELYTCKTSQTSVCF